jgi:hypothetical protein
MHRTSYLLLVTLLGVGLVTSLLTDAAARDKKKADRVFEMRIYTTAPGKLDALHARFRDHTNKIFVKHGMQLVGYWTPTDDATASNTLIYILAYPSLEARQASWNAFKDDPDWKKAFAESRADGPIVTKVDSRFMTPTDYSPIK